MEQLFQFHRVFVSPLFVLFRSNNVNPRPYFATSASGGGGVGAPPLPGVWKPSVVDLSGKTADCSRQELALSGAFFILDQYLTQL